MNLQSILTDLQVDAINNALNRSLAYSFDTDPVTDMVVENVEKILNELQTQHQIHRHQVFNNQYLGSKVSHQRHDAHIVEFLHLKENAQRKFKMSWRRAKRKIALASNHRAQFIHVITHMTPTIPVNHITLNLTVGAPYVSEDN